MRHVYVCEGAHWFLPCLVCDRSSGTFLLMRGRHWARGLSTSPCTHPPSPFPLLPPSLPPFPPTPFHPLPPTLSWEAQGGWRPPGLKKEKKIRFWKKGVTMKKNRSSNLRRAWPSSELAERPLEHNLSRSEKDIRVQKQHLPPPPPPHFSPSPPSYRAPGESDPPTLRSSTLSTHDCSVSKLWSLWSRRC